MRNHAMIGVAILLAAAGCSMHHGSTSTSGSSTTASPSSTGTAEQSNAGATSGTSMSGISEHQARGSIEQDGYTNVKNLRHSSDGGWTAQASAGGKATTVMVKPDGSVTHQ